MDGIFIILIADTPSLTLRDSTKKTACWYVGHTDSCEFSAASHSWGGSDGKTGNYCVRSRELECFLIWSPSRRLKRGKTGH
jgi:hypothetical protein